MPAGRPRCPKHTTQQQAATDRWRGSAASRGYGHGWRKRRDHLLARPRKARDGREVPPGVCELCIDALATDIDHIIPKSQGGADTDDNCQRLCASCHARKTATEDGGFGRAPRPARER